MSSGSLSRAEVAASLSVALLRPTEAFALQVTGRRKAAVLVPLYVLEGALHVVFTRRRDDMRVHPGQISFPGGSQDENEGLHATALREACEEIGLPAAAIEVLGALSPTPTFVSDFAIYPLVGIIEPGRTWEPSDAEVAAIIEPSVDELRAGRAERPVKTPRGTLVADTYQVGDDLIWGATARIVANLLLALD